MSVRYYALILVWGLMLVQGIVADFSVRSSWIVSALLDLGFWSIYLYDTKYKWRNCNTYQRYLIVLLVVRFCLYFLPMEVLSLPIVVIILNAISLGICYILLVKDDDDDNDKGKLITSKL